MLDVIRRNSQSWAVKAVFGAIILTFVFWGANSMTSNSVDVVAEVNGEPIYRNDLFQELRVQIQNIQSANPGQAGLDDEQLNALGMQVLSTMMRRSLLAQEARKLGLGVSDLEFSRVVTGMGEFYDATGRFNQKVYTDRIAALGMKLNQFEESIATGILVGKLQDYITGAVNVDSAEARRMFNFEMEQRVVEYLSFSAPDYRDRINPDESSIIAYYSENKDSYAVPAKADLAYLAFNVDVLGGQSVISDEDVKKYYDERLSSFVEPARYHVRHILVSLPLALDTDEQTVTTARVKAESILAELTGGKSFADLAKQYSADELNKDNGGDLGWVSRGDLVPSIDAILPDLKPGEVSSPIRTAYGFHLVEVLESTSERQKSLEDVRGDILAQLKEDAAYANLGKTMSDVEDKIIAGGTFEDLGAAYGVPVQESGLLEIASLPAALGVEPAALSGVSESAAGKLLPVIDAGNGFLVVKVNSYQPSLIPELEAVKTRIVESIKDRDSLKLASDAAAEASKAIVAEGKVPADLASKVVEATPITRFLGVLEFGVSQELTEAVFNAPKEQWIDRVFVVGVNAVLARVKGVLPADGAAWTEVEAAYIEGLNNTRRNELFTGYMVQLQKDAKVEVKTDRIVSR